MAARREIDDEALAEAVAKASLDVFNDAASDERARKFKAQQDTILQVAGVKPILPKPAAKVPHPQCDVCGKPNSKLSCSRCGSVWFCGRDCQVTNWKDGHKKECRAYRNKIDDDARRVISQISGTGGGDRTDLVSLLDNEACYLKALHYGLEGGLVELFREDSQRSIDDRFGGGAGGCAISWLQVAICEIFRGQRHSRRGTGSFGKADGQRCASYAASSPEAWGAWAEAAVALAYVPLHPQIRGHPVLHPHARRSARDAWALTLLALQREEFAREVLKDENGVKNTARLLGGALMKFGAMKAGADGGDPGGTIEGCIAQAAAMISSWCRRLERGVNFDEILGLEGRIKAIYYGPVTGMAEATLDKGATLTEDENNLAVQHFQKYAQRKQSSTTDSNITSSAASGRGKRKKKGKKGRG